MTKILVTGVTGFIGKHLIPKLRSCQHDIVEATRVDGDIGDKATWSNFERADVLVHLAASMFVPDSWKDPYSFLKTNFNSTVCALDYCRQYDAKLVYLSSYLYGRPEKLPIPESAPLIANNPYALSKKLSEEVCKFYSDNFGVKTTILRPFNIYGSGQSEKFLVPTIINQVVAGNSIYVKDLGPKRDYIYIDDLVDAIILAMDRQLDFGIFNIGTGVSHSVAELIDIIQKIQGTNLVAKSTDERRQEEVMDTQAGIAKASEVLGWTPKYSLHSGLKKILVNYPI
jgi:GDP-4-dehydro-6-deoxy-D-mannose reductase